MTDINLEFYSQAAVKLIINVHTWYTLHVTHTYTLAVLSAVDGFVVMYGLHINVILLIDSRTVWLFDLLHLYE